MLQLEQLIEKEQEMREEKKDISGVKWGKVPHGLFPRQVLVPKWLWMSLPSSLLSMLNYLLLHMRSSIGLMWSYGDKVCHLRELHERSGATFCLTVKVQDSHRLPKVKSECKNPVYIWKQHEEVVSILLLVMYFCLGVSGEENFFWLRILLMSRLKHGPNA